MSRSELRAFQTYLDELRAARPRLRLTALTDPEAIQRRHFIEPLALLVALEEGDLLGEKAIDIGRERGLDPAAAPDEYKAKFMEYGLIPKE